jgi:hypothetical protein
MQIRVKKKNPDGLVRLQTAGEVKDILINEDLLQPERESVSVCFRGKSSSGIVDFSPKEIEHIYNISRKRTGLIKGVKILSDK